MFVPPKELSEPDCSQRLFGDKPSVSIAGDALMAMAPEHSAPFKKMIGHPAIVQRFNWMLGDANSLPAVSSTLVLFRPSAPFTRRAPTDCLPLA